MQEIHLVDLTGINISVAQSRIADNDIFYVFILHIKIINHLRIVQNDLEKAFRRKRRH